MCGPRTHSVAVPGPDERKIGESVQGEDFSSALIWNEPAEEEPLWEFTLMQRGLLQGFTSVNIEVVRVEFERLMLTQGKSSRLFLKFQLSISQHCQTSKETWWIHEHLCSVIICLFSSPDALFKAATAVALQQCSNPEKQNPLFSKLGYSTIYKSNKLLFIWTYSYISKSAKRREDPWRHVFIQEKKHVLANLCS